MKKQKEMLEKRRFTKELVLAIPSLDNKMGMGVDVLDYVIGGVLFIECEDGK